ncbi:sensor histidine kinase [Maricaulis parjimensis]|uniref:sensor histidine kinase n=1 Tax=Maricaulis parjimensis TaxID=144023 RepID=UPI00193973F0|nr:ATP-binding protein [Maricaulis parjimensis]
MTQQAPGKDPEVSPHQRYETLTGLLDAYRTPVTIILFGLIVSLALFFATLVNQSRAQEREFRAAAEGLSREFESELNHMEVQLNAYARALDAGLSAEVVQSVFASSSTEGLPQLGHLPSPSDTRRPLTGVQDEIAHQIDLTLSSSALPPAPPGEHRLIALPNDGVSSLRIALVRHRPESLPSRIYAAAPMEDLLPPDTSPSPILWVIASMPGDDPVVVTTGGSDAVPENLPPVNELLRSAPFRVGWTGPNAFEGLELSLIPRRSFLLSIGPLPWLVLAFSMFATMTLGALALKDARRAVDIRIEVARKTIELKESHAIIEAKNHDLARFASHASHDLQAPLRIMQGMSALLVQRHAELDDRSQDMLARINRGAERAQRLVQDLLSYTKADAARLNPETLAPQDLTQEIEELLEAPIQESGARLEWDFDGPVQADRFLLTRALQNLVSNGLKYRGDAMPHIRISSRQSEHGCTLCVEDNGIGIEPEHFGRIFEVFERLHTAEKYEGSGIGLALCRRAADLHGGRIWVESEPGLGSRFYLFIPQTAADTPGDAQRMASNDH